MTLAQGLFGDPQLEVLVGPEGQVRAMLRAESALALAQADLNIIPQAAAEAIEKIASELIPDPAAVISGTAGAGIAAQPVINALKAACPDHAEWVHFGATSQDIQDTGLVLQLRKAVDQLEQRLIRLNTLLDALANQHADQPIPARTRFQNAAPTTLGAKIAIWQAPLERHLTRLDELRPRLLQVALFGAVGNLASLYPHGPALRRHMAQTLGLQTTEHPWHTVRDGLVELGGWLAMVTGSLGKMGIDLILLGQSDINELRAGTGGGSSTMPQKSNPVAAEALVSIARLNAGAVGMLHHAMIHALERDGTALGIEWATLPDMVIRTGAALRLANDLAGTIVPNHGSINASFAADQGQMLAEAAGFALTRNMPRKEALTLVGQALREVADDRSKTLPEVLNKLAPRDEDWCKTLAPNLQSGEASAQARNRSRKGDT